MAPSHNTNSLLQFKAEIYKWQRGSWVNTIFSLYRPDLCASLFKPTEIWYSFIVQLPKEDRKCPPEKGHVYYLKNLSNRMEVYNLRIAGDYSGKYKSIMHYTFDNTTLCVSFEFNAWKS
uniref:MD-2-related lipid-recognition domain-containing protein n=1 Tax=Stomoxys calcitrans TaxID=35570 RepID=A0A1I8Q860_STOCA